MNPSHPSASKLPRGQRIQRALRDLFARMWVEISIGVLVVVSVFLTLLEFTILVSSPHGGNSPEVLALMRFNDAITAVFIVELTLRFFAAPRKRQFFREFWIDILAVIPLFRIFRFARALRLLRLVRVLRLFGVASRLSSHFPYVLRQGMLEYSFVCGLLVITVIFGTGAMMILEQRTASASADGAVDGEVPFNLENSFWFSVYSLFAGEPTPVVPKTLGGKLVAVFIMFMGLTIFAMLTGTVSAFMVERYSRKGDAVQWEDLEDHIIICGWNTKAEIIIEEYQATPRTKNIPIVVIAQREVDAAPIRDEIRDRILFLDDDFTRIAALEKCGVHRAKTCIILADTSGNRSEQDADARTILAGLTVEKLNPSVYTCAELINRSYGMHLDMGHVNDYVISGEYSAYMLAQSAMNRGLMGVFTELLTYTHGNEFYRLEAPAEWVGRTFVDRLAWLKEHHNAILVGVCPPEGKLVVNPADHTFAENDEIIVIAEKDLQL